MEFELCHPGGRVRAGLAGARVARRLRPEFGCRGKLPTASRRPLAVP
jgi:hypothetical protein